MARNFHIGHAAFETDARQYDHAKRIGSRINHDNRLIDGAPAAGSAALAGLRTATRRLPTKAQIYREGERLEELYLVQSGWAFRYKLLFDGSRQILDFAFSGDLMGFPLNENVPVMDHSVETATETSFCVLPLNKVVQRAQSDPAFASTLMWMTSSEKARAYQRIIDLGRRNARERVAHFLLDIFNRRRARGGVEAQSCEFPITQSLIADTLGLSTVHVNRVIRQLREAGIATIANYTLTIHAPEMLEDICDYNETYLDHEFHRRAAPQPAAEPRRQLRGRTISKETGFDH